MWGNELLGARLCSPSAFLVKNVTDASHDHIINTQDLLHQSFAQFYSHSWLWPGGGTIGNEERPSSHFSSHKAAQEEKLAKSL